MSLLRNRANAAFYRCFTSQSRVDICPTLMAVRRAGGTKTARERVRERIRQRLADLHLTGRAFGRAFSANDGRGHVDTWVSGLLSGQFALSLDELDEAAYILKLTPAALVKSEYETAEYLTPSEYRIVTAMRTIPPAVRDHFLLLAEYLIGVLPEEIDMLQGFRELTADQQRDVRHSIRVLRIAQRPLPELAIVPGVQEGAGRPTDAEHRSRTRVGQRRRKDEATKR